MEHTQNPAIRIAMERSRYHRTTAPINIRVEQHILSLPYLPTLRSAEILLRMKIVLGNPGQHLTEPRPVGAERRVGRPHRERVVPEIDEHANPLARVPNWIFNSHIRSAQKYRDALGVPGVEMIGPRISLSGRRSDGTSCMTI